MIATTWQTVSSIGFTLLLVVMACVVGFQTLKKSHRPVELIFKWIITIGVILGTLAVLRVMVVLTWPIIVLIPAAALGIMWAPSIGAMMSKPFTSMFDGGDEELEPQPFYSIAESKRRDNHYNEAMQLVRAELEKFPDDFRGTMLLASIQAEDLKDLHAAQATLESWMERPIATQQGISSALTAIADWNLLIAQDPEGARDALQRIVRLMPDTPLAHQAQQRLARLPTVEHLKSLTEVAAMDLPAGEKSIGLRKTFTPALAADDSGALADNYVRQLQEHPADTLTREKLAVLYAEQFQRLDLAVDQLEQLINFPNESPKHIVHWLNLLADLQIRFGNDIAAAEAPLRRIIELFPNSAHVDQAQARLGSLGVEIKGVKKTALKTLGSYEKNIGLKPSRP